MNSAVTHNEQETIQAGKRFASRLKPGDVVACYGELGSGKTRFIKGICERLGVHGHVASPTFNILNIYSVNSLQVYHFDLYRLNDLREVLDLGFEEYTSGEGICLIEWAEKAADLLPAERYDVSFRLGASEQERGISISHSVGVPA